MDQPIKVQYESVSPALYWKAAQAACKTRPNNRILNAVFLVGGWIVIFGLVSLALRFEAIARGGPAILAGMVLMWVGLIIMGRIQRAKMNGVLADEQARRGPTEAIFNADGCIFRSAFGDSHFNWRAVDEVVDLGDGTGLRVGLMMYPIPAEGLPEGLEQAEFRRTLKAWVGHT